MTTTSYAFAKTCALPGWNEAGGDTLGTSGAAAGTQADYIGACAPMSTKPKTLLIVDDDEGMRDTLTAILRVTTRC